MARLPQPGGDAGNWGDILNDYLAQSHKTDGTIKDNTVGAAQLQDNSVTSATLAPNSVTSAALASDSVNATAIADGTITETLLASAVQTKLNAPATIADDTIQKTQLTSSLRTEIDTKLTQSAADTIYAPISVKTELEGRLSEEELSAAYAPASVDRSYALNDFLYQPTSTSLLKWRTRANEAAQGGSQAHCAMLGDSITYGAAGTGASLPKHRNSWPGRVRRHLDSLLGFSGSGIVPAVLSVTDAPAYDPRWAFTGTINRHNFGLHASTCLRVTPGATVSFTADNCNEFIVYAFSGGTNGLEQNEAQIDGGAVQTFKNNVNASAGSVNLQPETGRWKLHVETKIPAGSVGTHTLKITRPASSTADLFLWAIEARNTTAGRIRVSNLGYNGKSLGSFTVNDETNGLFGLPMLDSVRADLLVVGLGINDWQGQSGSAILTNTRDRLKLIIQRQRSTGSTPGGVAHPGGDAVLVWFPQPDTTTLATPPNQNPSWESMREVFYAVADEENVALLDLGMAWDGFATANGLGLFADLIHPNDRGLADISELFTRGLLPVSRP